MIVELPDPTSKNQDMIQTIVIAQLTEKFNFFSKLINIQLSINYN